MTRAISVLIVVGLIVGGVWLVQSGPGETRGTTGVLEAPGPAPSHTDTPRQEAAEPLAMSDTAPSPGARPDADAVADRWSGVGRPLLLQGVITGADAAPLAGARVHYIPNGASHRRAGLVPRPFLDSTVVVYTRYALELLPLAHYAAATTDDAGRFTLTGAHVDMSAGPSNDGCPWPLLVVTAPGMAVGVRRLTDLPTKALDHEPAETNEPFDIGAVAVEPAVSVSGRALAEDGRPLADVPVVLWSSRASPRHVARLENDRLFFVPELMSTTTGPDGTFRLDGLWPGRSQVVLHAPDHVRSVQDVDPGEEARVDLGDLVLARGLAIEGRVTDTRGTPIADAEVLVTDREITGGSVFDMMYGYKEGDDTIHDELAQTRRGVRWLPARTDTAGRFRIPGLDEANYNLYVDADGFEPTRVREIGPGAAALHVHLAEEALLRVDIVDAITGEPLPGATLQARRISGVDSSSADVELVCVSPGDPAAAEVLPPGSFLVRRVGPVGTWLHAEAAGRATVGIQAQGVETAARGVFTLEMSPESVLGGRVIDEDGRPVAAAEVLMMPPGRRRMPVATHTTGADGRFRIAGLGRLQLELFARGPDRAESAAAPVSLEAGETRTDLEFVVPRAARIHGRVVGDDGEPREGLSASIDIQPYGQFKFWEKSEVFPEAVRTDGDGRFAIEGITPGTYQLQIHREVKQELTLTSGEDREVDVSLRPRASVRGRLTSAGEPVEGIPVKATQIRRVGHSGPLDRGKAVTDTDGQYELSLRGGGDYEVLADPYGGAETAAEVSALESGEHFVVDLRLPAGAIEGRIRTADGTAGGTPLANAELTLDDHEDFKTTYLRSDEQGRFRFVHLPAGQFRIRYSGYGRTPDGRRGRIHQPYESDLVTVAEGAIVIHPEIVIVPGHQLSGAVRTGQGLTAKDGLTLSLVRHDGGTLIPGTRWFSSMKSGQRSRHVASENRSGLWDTTQTKAGRFVFTGLPPGEYRVLGGQADGQEVMDLGVSVNIVDRDAEQDLVARP